MISILNINKKYFYTYNKLNYIYINLDIIIYLLIACKYQHFITLVNLDLIIKYKYKL